MNRDRARLHFPRLTKVEMKGFSLYTQKPHISLTIPQGVTCLAGANGLGKSTFLAAINFAITGRVPDPGRAYNSADEYYSESASFTADFFEGRIIQADRKTAEVMVAFVVNDLLFEITRGAFEPQALRSLTITQLPKNDTTAPLFDGSAQSTVDLHSEYASRLTKAIGLRSFPQFVFLQHFVLTFDESRSLLFWDEKGLEASLFLAFGEDPDQQQTAEHYRREMEREESNARNTKWHARRVQKRIDDLRAVLDPHHRTEDFEVLEQRLGTLLKRRDELVEQIERTELRSSDISLRLAGAVAKNTVMRNAYANAFAEFTGDSSLASQHPIVLEATRGHEHCRICGTTGTNVGMVVAKRIANSECPLCASPLLNSERGDKLEVLRRLDEEIAVSQSLVEEVVEERGQVQATLTDQREQLQALNEQVSAFEEDHGEVAQWLRGQKLAKEGGFADQLARLEEEMRTLLQQSRAEYARRDEWKSRLQTMQKALHRRYEQTEEEFVPLFRNLAGLFIGIDLDINVEARRTVTTSLVLEMRSTPRRQQYQLSESQRFFLDIALRMALAKFASHPTSPATLFVDTPEGSLDIAYEARAGKMFAEFVKQDHNLLMTANINTSELLREMAMECGSRKMKLVKMTEWTDLSEVQLQEEARFARAFKGIEEALRDGDERKKAASGEAKQPKKKDQLP